ncbi:hypothetical protein [Bergeyella sp. RCAD1439]|uniref:hypothetical protein n=1 Tax=Bergeyella anatis TaxID=3113737 RepID=UPI002E16CC2B|nr:hypothetical protein [Bergeyella sp. RCAD1439]
MKKHLFMGIGTALLLTACNKKNEITVSETPDSTGVFKDQISVADSTLAATTDCYAYTGTKDSLYLQMDDNLGTITGKIRYAGTQNLSGDIVGTSHGDTIKVDCSYQSDGQEILKEIWFLKQNDRLREGTGKYDANLRYADPKTVKFEGQTLAPVRCEEIQTHFTTKP